MFPVLLRMQSESYWPVKSEMLAILYLFTYGYFRIYIPASG